MLVISSVFVPAGIFIHVFAALFPDNFSSQVDFGPAQRLVAGGQIEVLVAAFFANINAMATGRVAHRMKSGHGADEFSLAVEHEDRARVSVMRDVNQALLVDTDAMRGVAVVVTRGQVRHPPVVMADVLMFSLADKYRLGASFIRGSHDSRNRQ